MGQFTGEQASVDLSRLSDVGWQLDAFKAYVAALFAAKGSDPKGGDNPGLDWQHATVLAISSEGRCVPFTLAEFVTRFAVELAKPEQARVMYGKGG